MKEKNGSPMKRILISEDEKILALNYKKYLEAHGFYVEISSNANEALEKIHLGAQFDLIITDLNMPKWDGSYIISGIYSQQKNLKVIVVTGFADDSDYLKSISEFPNVLAVLNKPVEFEELLKIVKKALDIN